MKTTAFAAALAVAVGLFFPATGVAQQPAHLVKDINPGVSVEEGVRPVNLVTYNGAVYYSAYDDFHGQALWRSDGSPQGTRMIFDFTPGWNSGLFSLAARREGLIILHESGEIWTSDGTAANTRRAATIEGLSNAAAPVAVGSLVFFLGHSNTQGWMLARTDGTPHGTFVVSPLSLSGWRTVSAANLLYFQTGTDQWWRSDGTAAGTFPVAYTGVYALSAAAIGDTLFFAKCEWSFGCELWRSDGTSSGLAVDLEPGPDSSSPYALSAVGSTLYFATHPRGVWRTDGTPGGTTRVTSDVSVIQMPYQFTPAFADADSAAIFIGTTGDGQAFWRTDGTAAGTRMLAPVTSINQYLSDLTLLGDSTAAYATLAKWTSTGEFFREVWRVTGAAAQRLEQTNDIYDWYGGELTLAGGRAFYPRSRSGSGAELWLADATGTRMVVDTAPASSSWPWRLHAAGSTVFFIADANHDPVTPSYGELWKSDGSADGTAMVKDLTPGLDGTSFDDIVAVPGRVFFRRATWYLSELWTSDGTAGGTVKLADSIGGGFGVAGSQLFFSRFDGSAWGLWKTDGTDAGTVLVHQLSTMTWSGGLFGFQAIGPLVYFTACTNDHGCEPWVTDGTETGTRLLQDLAPGSASSYPNQFTAWSGGAVFFAGGLQQLWKTDGTAEGTVLIADLGSQALYGLTALEDRLVFAVTRPTHPYGNNELWVTDGTAAGTRLLREQELRNYDASMYGFARIGDLILFVGYDANHGREVWRTDGTVEGTTMVVDLAPGGDSGVEHGVHPPFAVSGLRALFAGMTREYGTEVFVTDGTAEGTRVLSDINPGSEPSNPYELVVAGANLFVAAGRPDVGYELWTVVLSPAGALDDLAQNLDAMALPQAVRQSLKAKLQAAAKALERGDGTAANLLLAFIYQIEALAGTKISDADAAELIEAARRIIASLG